LHRRIFAGTLVHPERAETAHLANDCLRDLDGLGADDRYGNIAAITEDLAGASVPA
jgi:hypothetical protein